ncbi:hypothetical protein M7I_1697 [Glarea lozoyensis 74030]|uniref:BTB domain-containing protein n=1 Tax=Glarea lozoyensis (strain ATCC 74030 / MF5533) TaxID=1104152 RepID=H0EGS7_GLAL7|nr:hypothetical protein M7I_1697 [Glarea lozoyensis 74030]
MAEPPLKKLKKDFDHFTAPLKVLVGDNGQEFYINEQLICSMSKLFEELCKKKDTPKKKAGEKGTERSRTFAPPDEDPNIFALFLVWLTNGNIDAAEDLVQIRSSPLGGLRCEALKKLVKEMDLRFFQLVDCYYLGSDIQSEEFQNFVMDSIVDLVTERTSQTGSVPKGEISALASSTKEIHEIYVKTWADSPLRMFLHRYHLCEQVLMTPAYVQELIELGCHDYISDVITESARFYTRPVGASRFRTGKMDAVQ